MEKNIVSGLPAWWKDENECSLILSNDIDSLASCCLLQEQKVFKWYINYFYNFSNIYVTEECNSQLEDSIGVDVSLCYKNMKCFDNHVDRISKNDYINPNMINVNIPNGITRDNYYSKYGGSTLLQLYSLYRKPLPITDEGKLVLLAIDSAYKGKYSKCFKPKYIYDEAYVAHKKFMCDILEFGELFEFEIQHRPSDFSYIINKYNLNSDIYVGIDGALRTDIKLKEISKLLDIECDLPEDRLSFIKRFRKKTIDWMPPSYKTKDDLLIDGNIFSSAITKKNKIRLSYCEHERYLGVA